MAIRQIITEFPFMAILDTYRDNYFVIAVGMEM
jgi:hypothetical protein